jgi:tRNA A37 N6-isopentenylltransferase MiaA
LVEDVISNPPKSELYECLKGALIDRLSNSDSRRMEKLLEVQADSRRMEKLLEVQDLGDRTPFQLFLDMRKLAGSAVSNDFLTTSEEESPSREYEGDSSFVGG